MPRTSSFLSALMLVLLLGVLAMPRARAQPAAAPEAARSADSFIDTIGVNTHLHYTDTVYSKFDAIIKPRLLELGIRHVRDGVPTYAAANRDTFFYQRCRMLAAAGIKFNFITSMKTQWGEATDYSKLGDAYNWCDGAVDSFEGINEPDLQNVGDWVAVTRAAQQQLYQTVKGAPSLKNLPVIGTSVTSDNAANSLGDLTKWLDRGNVHNYYGGRNPESNGWGNNGYGSIAWSKNYLAKPVSGDKPIVATETGWHNAINSTKHLGTPEKVVATYMPRLFLQHFNAGIVRTYPYEFIDQGTDQNDAEANFGLLHNDGSPKPSFTALKHMIALLGDPGPSFTPGKLDFALGGDSANVQHTLLQKRNGDFYLALWIGAPSWDPNAKTVTPVPDQAVTLTLPAATSATAYTFAAAGTLPSRALTITNKTISLQASERVTFVKLTTPPPATTPTPTGPMPTPKPGTYLPLIQSLALLNADTDQLIGALQDGQTLSFAALGTSRLSVRADTSPATVGSVTFTLDGALIQTENYAPYAIAGDSNNGADYKPWTPGVGTHTLTITPYTAARGTGQAGTPLTVTFTAG